MNELLLGLAMLAVFALALGGGWLLRGRRDVQRGWLMIACAAVILANVVIWTL